MGRLGKGRSGGKGEDCEGNGKVERKRGRLSWKDKIRIRNGDLQKGQRR